MNGNTSNNNEELRHQKILAEEKETRKELLIHMAKAFLENSVFFHENVFRFISTVLVVLIPAYIGLLELQKNDLSLPILIYSLPILFWFISLILCLFVVFRKEQFNLFNVESIIEVYSKALKMKRKFGFLAFIFLLLGFLLAGIIIFICR